jgi:hypothetical protein
MTLGPDLCGLPDSELPSFSSKFLSAEAPQAVSAASVPPCSVLATILSKLFFFVFKALVNKLERLSLANILRLEKYLRVD